MDIHKAGKEEAARKRAATTGESLARQRNLDGARQRILDVNQQLPGLAGMLRNAGVRTDATAGEPSYRTSGFGRRKISIQNGHKAGTLVHGWKLFSIKHQEAGQVNSMSHSEGSTYEFGLLLTPHDTVLETQAENIEGPYNLASGLPPSFLHPEVDRSLRYSFELGQALRQTGTQSVEDPIAVANAFAAMYESTVTALVAKLYQ